MASTSVALPGRAAGKVRRSLSLETGWGIALVLPYVVFFLAFVVWPVVYGLWLGSSPASYATLLADPLFLRTLGNTVVFLGVGINLKLFLALLLSGFFANTRPWIRWLSVIFILPWAVPSIPTILSFRWMLNSEWGMVNGILWDVFGIEGPWWLVDPQLAFASVITVHVWKYLPFWTLILLAGRMAIPTDLYEAARIDGASRWQEFRDVTLPGIRPTIVFMILMTAIGAFLVFDYIWILTQGGPAGASEVLATLVFKAAFNNFEAGYAAAIGLVMSLLAGAIISVFVFLRRRGWEI